MADGDARSGRRIPDEEQRRDRSVLQLLLRYWEGDCVREIVWSRTDEAFVEGYCRRRQYLEGTQLKL